MFKRHLKSSDATQQRLKAIPIFYSTVPRLSGTLKAGAVVVMASIVFASIGISPVLAATATGSNAAPIVLAQQSKEGSAQRPPREAVEACSNKKAQSSCSFSDDKGTTIKGTCSAPDSKAPLACAPADMSKKG